MSYAPNTLAHHWLPFTANRDFHAEPRLLALDRAARLAPYFLDRMFELSELPAVTDVRGYGLLAAFDLAPEGEPGARGYACLKRLFEEGLLIKWTGDTGIIAPALVAEQGHVDEIADILRRVLRAL